MKSALKQTQAFHIAAALFALCAFAAVRAQSVMMSPAGEVTAMDLDGDGKLSWGGSRIRLLSSRLPRQRGHSPWKLACNLSTSACVAAIGAMPPPSCSTRHWPSLSFVHTEVNRPRR